MRPCCLDRIHQFFPQYIPSLFPYSTPIFDTSSSSSKVSRVSKISQLSQISRKTAEPSRSSPVTLRPHSVLSDTDSTPSQPRRASMPARLLSSSEDSKPSQHNIHRMEMEGVHLKKVPTTIPHRKYNIALVSMSPSPINTSNSPQVSLPKQTSYERETSPTSTTRNHQQKHRENNRYPIDVCVRGPSKEEVEKHDKGLNELRSLFSNRNKL